MFYLATHRSTNLSRKSEFGQQAKATATTLDHLVSKDWLSPSFKYTQSSWRRCFFYCVRCSGIINEWHPKKRVRGTALRIRCSSSYLFLLFPPTLLYTFFIFFRVCFALSAPSSKPKWRCIDDITLIALDYKTDHETYTRPDLVYKNSKPSHVLSIRKRNRVRRILIL